MNQIERLKVLAEKVQEMRTTQRDYFRTRSNDAMQKAKRLEREVDKLLPDALRDDDMLEMMASSWAVAALPPAKDRTGAERVVTDCLNMLVGAIAVGGGVRKAKVRSDGQDWRVVEWLAPER